MWESGAEIEAEVDDFGKEAEMGGRAETAGRGEVEMVAGAEIWARTEVEVGAEGKAETSRGAEMGARSEDKGGAEIWIMAEVERGAETSREAEICARSEDGGGFETWLMAEVESGTEIGTKAEGGGGEELGVGLETVWKISGISGEATRELGTCASAATFEVGNISEEDGFVRRAALGLFASSTERQKTILTYYWVQGSFFQRS